MKHETDFLFNRKDLAAAFSVSTQAVGAWDLNPVRKPGASGNRTYYDIREVIKYRIDKALDVGGNIPDIQKQKSRLAKSSADMKDLELAKMKGEMIPADDVTKHWQNLFLAFRAKILAIPQRAAMVALAASSIPEVEESLSQFLNEALIELSGDGMPDEYKAMRQESPINTEAASTTNSEHVG